jgi:RNA polymerase sigma factor (TIGR02999 family)
MAEASDITGFLLRAAGGDDRAWDEVAPLVYDELHRIAVAYLRGERPGHTLQPTALVHEAFLKLLDQSRVEWRGRAHFLAVAAQAMRRVLVDHARRRRAQKRGAGVLLLSVDDMDLPGERRDVALDDLDAALTDLARLDQRPARVVELRFFGGLSIEETAEVLGVSPATVKRDWTAARAWLYRELAGPGRHPA